MLHVYVLLPLRYYKVYVSRELKPEKIFPPSTSTPADFKLVGRRKLFLRACQLCVVVLETTFSAMKYFHYEYCFIHTDKENSTARGIQRTGFTYAICLAHVITVITTMQLIQGHSNPFPASVTATYSLCPFITCSVFDVCDTALAWH